MHDLVYNQFKTRATELEQVCRLAINQNHVHVDAEDSTLRIAFVGQYNAGKSSLVKMLTGIDGIAIGSNVTTDRSKDYSYKGLHIVDTPGIRAGYSLAHDEAAFAAIAKADLLIFVITNELFDEVLKAEFRKLCFDHRREKEILLVLNKSQSDAGTRQTKLDGIAPVLQPLIPESFPIVFTDAESYFDALDEVDIDERNELLELSNRDGLMIAIDNFAAERGLYARLTTPLQGVLENLQAALESLKPANPVESGAISLMRQVKRLLQESRRSFEKSATAIIDSAHSKIVREGASLASLVGSSADEFEHSQTRAVATCKSAGDEALGAISEQLRSDLKDLEDSLEALANSPMAKRVMVALGAVDPDGDISMKGAGISSRNLADNRPFDARFGKSMAEHAQKGLALIAKSAVGNSAKEGLKGVSGSALHETVKKVGELVGYRFKAWEAVKIADYIGKGAKFLGPVMAVAGVGMQIYSDRQEANVEAKLTGARREIRRSFLECAETTKSNLQSALADCFESGFDPHIKSVNDELNSILKRDADQSQEARALVEHMNNVIDFLQEVSEKMPWGSR